MITSISDVGRILRLVQQKWPHGHDSWQVPEGVTVDWFVRHVPQAEFLSMRNDVMGVEHTLVEPQLPEGSSTAILAVYAIIDGGNTNVRMDLDLKFIKELS